MTKQDAPQWEGSMEQAMEAAVADEYRADAAAVTPTQQPWRFDAHNELAPSIGYVMGVGANGWPEEVATCYGDNGHANAHAIVRACNSHQALIDALKEALPFVAQALGDGDRGLSADIRAVIASAEGGH